MSETGATVVAASSQCGNIGEPGHHEAPPSQKSDTSRCFCMQFSLSLSLSLSHSLSPLHAASIEKD